MGVAAWGALVLAAGASAGALRAGAIVGAGRRTDRALSELRLAIAALRRDLAIPAARGEPWWAVLRVPREATRPEIRRAYQALSRATLLRARRGHAPPGQADREAARLRAALAQALRATVDLESRRP